MSDTHLLQYLICIDIQQITINTGSHATYTQRILNVILNVIVDNTFSLVFVYDMYLFQFKWARPNYII